MMHAYDEYYMPTIRDKLAEMFEIAVIHMNIDIDEFARLFSKSIVAKAFMVNAFKYTYGKSSIELLENVLGKNLDGIELHEPATPEYWVGYVYAFVSWYYNVTYGTLFDAIKPSILIMYYFPYHEMDITRVLDLFEGRIKFESKLKRIREFKNYSQKELSIMSNVPIRTIRSYEQNTCDISKASYETLYKLSKALDCKVEDLIN